MNRNIEVINQNLWSVDFNIIRYISELNYLGDFDSAHLKIATYTNDGKIVLNKCHEAFNELKQMLLRFMTNSDQELQSKIRLLRSKERDPFEEFYMFALDLEAQRRTISKEYAKVHKPSSIKKLIIEKVVKRLWQH